MCRNRKKRIFNKYFSTHEKNISTVIIFEADDTLATVLNLPLSKAEPTVAGRREKQITARLSGFFMPIPQEQETITATHKLNEPPCSLCLTAEQQLIFDSAESAGLMEQLPDGCYQWLASKALLSYFCGRVFCGDYSKEGVWECGKGRFPNKEVEKQFGVDGVAEYRRKRVLLCSPKGYEAIDRLWL